MAANTATLHSNLGFPCSPGNKPWSVIDLTGLSSYTVVSVASPPTGGQALTPGMFGLQKLEFVWVMGSDTGAYNGVVFMNPLASGRECAAAILMWTTAATGAEVTGTTDLSAKTLRLMAIGS